MSQDLNVIQLTMTQVIKEFKNTHVGNYGISDEQFAKFIHLVQTNLNFLTELVDIASKFNSKNSYLLSECIKSLFLKYDVGLLSNKGCESVLGIMYLFYLRLQLLQINIINGTDNFILPSMPEE